MECFQFSFSKINWFSGLGPYKSYTTCWPFSYHRNKSSGLLGLYRRMTHLKNVVFFPLAFICILTLMLPVLPLVHSTSEFKNLGSLALYWFIQSTTAWLGRAWFIQSTTPFLFSTGAMGPHSPHCIQGWEGARLLNALFPFHVEPQTTLWGYSLIVIIVSCSYSKSDSKAILLHLCAFFASEEINW